MYIQVIFTTYTAGRESKTCPPLAAPTMQFAESSYNAGEESGRVVTYIRRRGDVTHASSVRCYTRQDSATVMADFAERPDSDASRVHFLPGGTTGL